MINQSKIVTICNSFLADTNNYLIDVKVSPSNKIMIHIENDQHVSIQDCIALSRFVENQLDREKEDFELEVSSPGIDQPFKILRQYQKYYGKPVEVKLVNGTVTGGILEDANTEKIVLRIENLKRKGKAQAEDVAKLMELPMNEVKETKLKLIF